MTKQSQVDSLMEAVCNVGVGFVVSLASIPVINWLLGIDMGGGQTFGFVGLFTITSVARQYLLRRVFNGRSVWEAIRWRRSSI